jgi:NADPH-dependent 2,4-dienoyl-CoA reductase/sulfur reductase-like enzyme
VALHEATPHLGGNLRLARDIPFLGGVADVLPWLESQVYSLGVSVHTSSYVDASDIIAAKPDVVLVATGAAPREDGWQLAMPSLCLDNLTVPFMVTVADLLEGRTKLAPGATVVIVDDTGHAEAPGVAEYLLAKGFRVEYITRFPDIGSQLFFAQRSRPTLRRLNSYGNFSLNTHSFIAEVSPENSVTIGSLAGLAEKTVQADHAIFVGFNTSQDDIIDELQTAGYEGRIEPLGDANSPRYLHAAIHDGFNIALSL